MGSVVQWVPGHLSRSRDPRLAWHNLPRAKPGEPGFVYFVMAGRDGPIKIGSTMCVEERLADLQIGSPLHLRLLALVDGGQKYERELHKRLAAHRLRGEWFENCAAVRAAMDERPSAIKRRDGVRYGPPCSNCRSMAPLCADGVCEACREFAELRDSDCDPFDESLPREAAA